MNHTTHQSCQMAWTKNEITKNAKNASNRIFQGFLKNCTISGDFFSIIIENPCCYKFLSSNVTLTTMQITKILESRHFTYTMMQATDLLDRLSKLPNAATLQDKIRELKEGVSV